ncbi:efflux RND transporter periplasmic adaptor subunit [uncultured Maricaulis sp.]|uniref:efflux RND transporter periplasmic adaptor subunit n=1 Tax=uncultured Maricaulis sp. TaxID=174710 RepID=UPI0030D85CD7|tara:strand:- start:65585 stop:66859 length:1275 start_codon:yes stop_codon:yes gene_type:complete
MGKLIGRFVIFGVAGAVVLLVIIALISTKPEPQRANAAPQPVAVFVEQARRENVALTVHSQGQARPRTQINLVPQVTGRITYVNPSFIEGGFFEAGETLVRIDDADYHLAATRAAALVAQAQQGLAREQAEAELAAREWADLGEGEASPLTLREPQLAEARAQLASAQASLQAARLDLQRTRVSAPFDGRVLVKSADLGQFVTAGTPLGEVFSTDTILVRLPLTDNDLGLLGIPIAYNSATDGAGIPVKLTATLAGEPREWQGFINRTESAIDPQTRVLYATAEVEDPYGAAAAAGAPLAVGLFVDAEIQGRNVQNAVVLPRSALRGENTVFVVNAGGILDIRTVTVVTSSTDRLVVSSGVSGGEMIVISPIRGASIGMRLRSLDANGEVLPGYSASIETETDEEDTTDTEAEPSDTEAVASAG